MLNYIWGFMVIIGIVFGFLTGTINEVARQAGIMEKMTKALMPVIRFLFPDIPKGHVVQEYIVENRLDLKLKAGLISKKLSKSTRQCNRYF